MSTFRLFSSNVVTEGVQVLYCINIAAILSLYAIASEGRTPHLPSELIGAKFHHHLHTDSA